MAFPSPARRLRWGYQESLFKPKNPAFWLFGLLIVAGGMLFMLEQLSYALTSVPALILSWILLGLYVIPMLLFVYYLDLYEREPISLVVGAFLWGALAATMLSGIGNVGWGLVVKGLGGAAFAARWSAAPTAVVLSRSSLSFAGSGEPEM